MGFGAGEERWVLVVVSRVFLWGLCGWDEILWFFLVLDGAMSIEIPNRVFHHGARLEACDVQLNDCAARA